MTTRTIFLFTFLFVLINQFTFNAYAIEILVPPQNTVVHPGDVIVIQVVPSIGEIIGKVYFGGLFGKQIESPPYVYHFTVGPKDIGEIKLSIFAIKPESAGPFATADDYFSSSVELNLISTLPPKAQ